MGKLRAKIQFDQTILFVLLLFFCITVYLRHTVATCIEESSSSGGTQPTTLPPLTVDYTVCKRMAPDLRQACIMRLQWWQEARKAEREGRIVPAKELPPPSQGLGLPTHRKATPAEKAAQPPPSVASERYGCLNTSCLCKYMKDQCISTAKAATQLFETSRPKRQSGEPDKSLARCKRMEYRMLSDDQRERFHNAWLQMKNGYGSHEYDRLSFFHCNPSLIPSAHGGPTFLLWHREYLKRMEIAIRAIDPSVCLPYWDVTLDQRLPKATDSIMWSKLFMGAPDNGNKFIADGFLANWYTSSGGKIRRDLGLNGRLFGEKEVLSMLTKSNMDFFFAFTNATPTSECTQSIPDVESENALELIHNYVHSWIGGQMTRLETSTEDPIFFVYHCFLDYIWEQWRQKWQNREQRETQYPPDDQIVPCSGSENYRLSATMYPFQDPVLLIKAGLSNEYTDNLYTYATRPSCTATNGCGSPYLFCDLTKQQTPEPLCCAKIKSGGDCSIFQGNNEEPCFDSVCINGICTASEKGTTTEHGETTTPQTETSSTTLGTTQLGETTATPTTGTSSTNIDTTLIGETTSTASDHFSTVFSLSPSLLTTEPTDQITLSTISSSTTLGTFTPNTTVSSSYTQNPSCCCVCKECDEEEQYKMSFIVPNGLNLEAKRKKHRKHKPRCGGRFSRKHRHHKSSSKSSSSSSSSSSSEEEDSNECDGKHTVAVTTTISSSQQITKSTDGHLGTTTPSPTPPPPKKRVCHDGHECCAHWAAKGACTSAPRHMNTWCSGTCRFNGCRPHPKQDKSGCKNLYSECHRWAHYHEKFAGTASECERNPHWMAQNCAKACQKCGATKPEQCIKNMPKDYQAPPIEYD